VATDPNSALRFGVSENIHVLQIIGRVHHSVTSATTFTMAALNRPTKASYEVHETFKVDTSGKYEIGVALC
jgi:hypothetical protein